MELFLQFGYGMMDHCRFLIQQWGNGTVVLSPRDLSVSQLEKLGKDVVKLGGSVLLDPQLYIAAKTTHPRLIGHQFWTPQNGKGFPTGADLSDCLNELISINHSIGAKRIILPGPLADQIDLDWLDIQKLVIEEAQRADLSSLDPILTLALSYDALRTDTQVHALLDDITSWDISSIYLVCEHPTGEYLVSDPSWLANFADVVAGLRLAGKEVIVGYSNHQMLILAAAAANAICSGTWMNVRAFDSAKFISSEDDEMKQRSTWYYAPHLFSEFKINFMDLAKKNGTLGLLQTPAHYGSYHADVLFTAPQPSLAGFTEQQAFRHYLQCLRNQTQVATHHSFDDTVDAYYRLLDVAESELTKLHSAGIKGQKRDFLDYIDVNRGALTVFVQNRGQNLRRRWASLID